MKYKYFSNKVADLLEQAEETEAPGKQDLLIRLAETYISLIHTRGTDIVQEES